MKKLVFLAILLGLILPSLTGCGRCKCVQEGVAPTETLSGMPTGAPASTGETSSHARTSAIK